MTEPIDKMKLLEQIAEYGREIPKDQVIGVIARQEDVEVEDRPRGEWVNDEHDIPRCSVCGYIPEFNNHIDDYYYSDYCPNCGADMRNDEDELTVTLELTITEEQKQRLDKYKADMRGEDE